MLTQARLKEVLKYNRKTGVFTWRKKGETDPPGKINDYGYLKLNFDGITIYAHQAAWMWVYGVKPHQTVDHIDGDRLNNQISNLRLCTIQQNVQYQKLHRDNRSGFKGVSWVAHRGKWRARIKVSRKAIHLGAHYDDPREAARQYDAAAVKFFGAFAKTNAALGLL